MKHIHRNSRKMWGKLSLVRPKSFISRTKKKNAADHKDLLNMLSELAGLDQSTNLVFNIASCRIFIFWHGLLWFVN